MTRKTSLRFGVFGILMCGVAIGVAIGLSISNGTSPAFVSTASAAPTPVQPTETKTPDTPVYSPVKARTRDYYAPNSEDLGPNEMRVIACGTGMPTARPKQAASCWLLELGNGDKFLFDVGTGSNERIAATQIP